MGPLHLCSEPTWSTKIFNPAHGKMGSNSRIYPLKIKLALCNLRHKIILQPRRLRGRNIIAFEHRAKIRKEFPVFLWRRSAV